MASSQEEELDTETKLAILASTFANESQEDLLDILIRAEGDIEKALEAVQARRKPLPIPEEEDEYRAAKRQKRESTSSDVSPTKQKCLSSILKWTPSAEPPQKVPSLLG